MSEFIQELNPEQQKAVEHFLGPIMVLAGAGSGKTRVLTNRIANLILNKGVRPYNILAVTFTNKATREMQERLKKLLGEQADRLWVSTFHSAALRILRQHAYLLGYPSGFAVWDDGDSKLQIKKILKELNIPEKENPVSTFTSAIDKAKNDYVTAEEYYNKAYTQDEKMIADVYKRYQEVLKEAGAMDFGDLLLNVVMLFDKHPEVLENYRRFLHFILVDEFQDTNKVQYLLIRQLAEPRRNIFVVGDDDQSIYGFRGAHVGNIWKFKKDFEGTEIVTLEQNYRSTANILDVAYSVISKNKERMPKKLWTASNKGDLITSYVAADEEDEADFVVRSILLEKNRGIPLSKIAVFYRTNAQSRALEAAMVRYKVPYRIYGGLKFYERKEIKDILAYVRLVVNRADTQAFMRAINTPARGIGATTLQKIGEMATRCQCSYWDVTKKLAESNSKIKGFVDLIEELTEDLKNFSIGGLVNQVIQKTGYEKKLKESKEIGNESRIENLRELVGFAGSEKALDENGEPLPVQAFLDKTALTTGGDISGDGKERHQEAGEEVDAVSLMTLHLAKGLEFPVVFFTGMENGLLPHYRSIGESKEVEEERRLCYVGITRAMQRLYITRAEIRAMFAAPGGLGGGRSSYREMSPFLKDIPEEYLKVVVSDKCFSSSSSTFKLRGDDESDWERDEYSQDEELVGWKKKEKKALPRALRNVQVNDFSKGGNRYPSDFSSKFVAKPTKASSFITVADEIHELPPDAILLKDHPEKAVRGLSVLHPHFGNGVVVSIDEPASHDPSKTKIKIKFDKEQNEKTLILGKALLAVV